MRTQSEEKLTAFVGETGGKGRARSGYRVGGWRIVQVFRGPSLEAGGTIQQAADSWR
jgi:hypothetical protein